MQKPTPSKDGIYRSSINITFRVSLNDLITIASHLSYHGTKLTKKNIEEELKSTLNANGSSLYGMDWEDEYERSTEYENHLLPSFEELETKILNLYPEFKS